MNFKKSLLLSLVLFSAIPIVILGFISAYLTANGIVNTRTTSLKTMAYTNGASLSQLIASQKREIEIMSSMAPLVKYLNLVNSDKIDNEQKAVLLHDLTAILKNWVNTTPHYDNAILVDYDGNIIAAFQTTDIGKNVSDKDYFRKGLLNNDTYFSNVTKSILYPDKKVFAMSHAVSADKEEYRGVLILFASIDFFEEFVKNIKFDNTGLAAIFDSTGEVVIHPDKNFVNSESSKSLAPVFANILSEYFAGKRPAIGTTFYKVGDTERLLGYSVLEENLNWLFIVRQDYDEIKAPAKVIYFATVVALLIFLVIAIISGSMLTNIFTKPLLILKKAFSKAAMEDSYLTCEVDSKNEFGELAESYNIMISRLNENFEEVLEAYEHIAAQEEELRQNLEDLNREKKQNEYLAYHDPVTGILNRAGFMKKLKDILSKGDNGGVFFIDLDDFKYVNSVLGHNHGDKILAKLGEKLSDPEFGLEFCARIGGDEFLLIKTGDEKEIEKIARKLLKALRIPFEVDGINSYITGSIGIAIFKQGGESANILVKNADIAMYKAKESGRNTYKFYNEEMQNSIDRRNKIIEVLRNAVALNEVFLVYQPEVDINSGKILAFESLMRIKSKELGFISPAEFIPVAEVSNIILQLGDWAINEACSFAKNLADKGIDFGTISVNISSVQLMRQEFVPRLLEIVRNTGLEPKYFQIEITESVLVNSTEAVIKKLKKIRETGISIALDDFGTGYSSLNYLINLPVDVLKIDKSFIDGIDTDAKKQIVCQTIINMSHKLGLKVVAEGIENEQEIACLKRQSCDVCQGYFFSRPIEEEYVTALIEKFSR